VRVANALQPLIDVEEWVLEALHAIGLGWGLAIVGLTVLVRLSTVPVVARQLRAQRDLRRHLPELNRIQERSKHDRERLSARRPRAARPRAAPCSPSSRSGW
jgi:YidC/Oxa1 family membrane protein insertase